MRTADKVQKIAIVGNGLMGQGIAHVFARKGRDVAIIGSRYDYANGFFFFGLLLRMRDCFRGRLG